MAKGGLTSLIPFGGASNQKLTIRFAHSFYLSVFKQIWYG